MQLSWWNVCDNFLGKKHTGCAKYREKVLARNQQCRRGRPTTANMVSSETHTLTQTHDNFLAGCRRHPMASESYKSVERVCLRCCRFCRNNAIWKCTRRWHRGMRFAYPNCVPSWKFEVSRWNCTISARVDDENFLPGCCLYRPHFSSSYTDETCPHNLITCVRTERQTSNWNAPHGYYLHSANPPPPSLAW